MDNTLSISAERDLHGQVGKLLDFAHGEKGLVNSCRSQTPQGVSADTLPRTYLHPAQGPEDPPIRFESGGEVQTNQ